MTVGKPSIKAVTFDLWETLLFEKNGWNLRRTDARCENLAKTLDKFGVKISVKQLALAFKKMAPWLERAWETKNEVTHLDQIRFLIKTASKELVTVKKNGLTI